MPLFFIMLVILILAFLKENTIWLMQDSVYVTIFWFLTVVSAIILHNGVMLQLGTLCFIILTIIFLIIFKGQPIVKNFSIYATLAPEMLWNIFLVHLKSDLEFFHPPQS